MELTIENIKCLPKLAGIYCIINTINNKKYVGLSVNVKRRLTEHINYPKLNPDSKILYNAFNKYGIDKFEFELLHLIYYNKTNLKDYLDSLEIKYIDKLDTYRNGYNATKGGDGVKGKIWTEEERQIKRDLYYLNSKLLQQAEKCKKITYLFNIKSKELLTFSSEVETAKYLVSLGFKSSIALVSKVIVGKYKQHHGYIIADSVESLEERKKDYYKPVVKSKINYDDFYELIKPYSDENYVLPTCDDLAILLNMGRSSVARRMKYLKEHNMITTTHIKDTKRYKLVDSVTDIWKKPSDQ